MSHTEDPRQTGRLAAYQFFIRTVIKRIGRRRHDFYEHDVLKPLQLTIRQALAGDLLCLNQTSIEENERIHQYPGFYRESLGSDLGGFGEGLKQGLKEIEALIQERLDQDH